ncbi:hypothetical protein CANARDRAFT_29589 [[Candida] arabinofermentans NRRL YB-2248]|uniref:5-oxoprolinase n=1 Tax=[Candida] arabinofermentans NRRL YB-2248 TaxID=983967 RepID=A0A1E4SWL0_9ASCO|nr:hypothetical protein CANARDRAFT_29589 [[Candida] arabinofermentans NRRL YB-2248]
MTEQKRINIAIDRGGTFTDVIAMIPGQDDYVFKLLSVDPGNYKDANIEGIRKVLEYVSGEKIPRGTPLDVSSIESIRLGTTVATNALLERKGEKIAFLTTKGFKDYLHISDQSRPDLFKLFVQKPGVLYDKVIEIDERVTLAAFSEDPEEKDYRELLDGKTYVEGQTKDVVQILKPVDMDSARKELAILREEGFETLAICLIHGYNFQEHEIMLKQLALDMGFKFVVTSHETMPTIKAIPRGQSTVVDAYLTPVIKIYIQNFMSGFKAGFEKHTRIEFMQSDGGLSSYEKFTGLKSLLSGPAGGVVGAASTCYDEKVGQPIIGFDMGGTSTDVSRFAGHYEHVFESVTAGINVAAPHLDINTVAAGGGSILFYEHGTLRVGPESASSHPGPACYRKGGPLTVTDANLFTGRILPEYFPKIFGPTEDMPLDFEIVKTKFEELTELINKENPHSPKTANEVALGFLKVANEAMAKPIRQLTETKGLSVSSHDLVAFGGAGSQNACDLATILKINRIIVHKYSSVLSAYGIALADIVEEIQEPSNDVYSPETLPELMERCEKMKLKVKETLMSQGVKEDDIHYDLFFNMGFSGSDTKIMVLEPEDGDFLSKFIEIHEREFSFVDETRGVMVQDLRIRGSGKISKITERSPYEDLKNAKTFDIEDGLEETSKKMVFESGIHDAKIYMLNKLPDGAKILGPALLLDATQTIIVTPNATALILPRHVVIDLNTDVKTKISTEYVDPIQLAVFSNRFMFIAEDMGRTLARISVSANIKERMDFSCALFDEDGNLTANAPHVPVHLGSMSFSVKYAKNFWGDSIKPGDVLATNSPQCGGTHLPDITLISPVFIEGRIRFFTASRAHHAEIGGITPGSVPPNAKFLTEEGAIIHTWKIISEGKFDYDGVNKYFVEEPAQYPGSSGTRKLKDNISDLKAQVASNQRGVNLLQDLFKEYGTEIVLFYMSNVRKSAELAVRQFFKKLAITHKGKFPLTSEEYLDDGSRLCCSISVNGETGDAVFDFTGTSHQAYNCYNAPPAVTYACVLYNLRVLIDADIPLNEGCLIPIEIIIPEGTILNPTEEAAVNAGNGNTSQRIHDTIMKCYQVAGAASGSMNVLTFGRSKIELPDGRTIDGFAHLDTIAGGSCASFKGPGYSGVQSHMTNTKITDPEILESRYPAILVDWSIRHGTGGRGLYKGGDGLQRITEFTTPVEVSCSAFRRVNSPYGCLGGEDGVRGETLYGRRKPDGSIQWIHLPGFSQLTLRAGDLINVRTPGSGGYGTPDMKLEDRVRISEDNISYAYTPLAGGTLGNRISIANTSQ